MLEKRVATNGKIYAKLSDLTPWEKNPRTHTDEDMQRLIRHIARYGQFKPVILSSEAKAIGGNKRLPALDYVNKNIVVVKEEDGSQKEIDRRGQFDDVWITEIGFAEEELTEEQKAAGAKPRYRAIVDNHLEETWFESVEQIVIEYAMADNDEIGQWDKKALHSLIQPHIKLIPLPDFKLHLSPSIDLKVFNDKQAQEAKKDDEPKSKKVIVKLEYTPEQYALIEPRMQKLQSAFGLENTTDFFSRLLELAEKQQPQN